MLLTLLYIYHQQNCLGLIYTVYAEKLSCSIEHVVGKLLAVQVPPPGSAMLRFSIGAADKQAIQTPLSDFLPVTTSSVAMLLRQLGMISSFNFFPFSPTIATIGKHTGWVCFMARDAQKRYQVP